jgi:hypothetical protein
MTRDPELAAQDIVALIALKARYLRFVDTKDWDGLRALFTDDLVVYKPGSDAGPDDIAFSDADSMVSYLRRTLRDAITVHHGYLPELERTDERTASGVGAMDHWAEDLLKGTAYRGCGHYHETYDFSDDRWRISRTRLNTIRIDRVPLAHTVES